MRVRARWPVMVVLQLLELRALLQELMHTCVLTHAHSTRVCAPIDGSGLGAGGKQEEHTYQGILT